MSDFLHMLRLSGCTAAPPRSPELSPVGRHHPKMLMRSSLMDSVQFIEKSDQS